jgi:Holliday junction resolvase RusA-like endonuclease
MKEIKLLGDIDNYTKTVLDGLNDVAWADDKQVIKLEVVKL